MDNAGARLHDVTHRGAAHTPDMEDVAAML
jgi:hypothetical protein